eukprot:3517909-Rhodomonas_salina.2
MMLDVRQSSWGWNQAVLEGVPGDRRGTRSSERPRSISGPACVCRGEGCEQCARSLERAMRNELLTELKEDVRVEEWAGASDLRRRESGAFKLTTLTSMMLLSGRNCDWYNPA